MDGFRNFESFQMYSQYVMKDGMLCTVPFILYWFWCCELPSCVRGMILLALPFCLSVQVKAARSQSNTMAN